MLEVARVYAQALLDLIDDAEEAGLTAGDILVSYAGQPTRSVEELRAAAGGATGEEQVPVVPEPVI